MATAMREAGLGPGQIPTATRVDIAAFMDRVDRAEGDEDFRMKAFRKTIAVLNAKQNRAEKVLLSFSDPTKEPIAAATTKAAAGEARGGASQSCSAHDTTNSDYRHRQRRQTQGSSGIAFVGFPHPLSEDAQRNDRFGKNAFHA